MSPFAKITSLLWTSKTLLNICLPLLSKYFAASPTVNSCSGPKKLTLTRFGPFCLGLFLPVPACAFGFAFAFAFALGRADGPGGRPRLQADEAEPEDTAECAEGNRTLEPSDSAIEIAPSAEPEDTADAAEGEREIDPSESGTTGSSDGTGNCAEEAGEGQGEPWKEYAEAELLALPGGRPRGRPRGVDCACGKRLALGPAMREG